MTDRELMEQALLEAELAADAGELPVGCVIARNGEIIARGHNLREATKDPTAHAEIVAIRRAAEMVGDWRLEDCELFVTLEPCPMCAGAIVMSGVDAVYYGAYDSRCGCAGSRYALTEDAAFGGAVPAHGGLLEAECASQLDAFFGARRERGERSAER